MIKAKATMSKNTTPHGAGEHDDSDGLCPICKIRGDRVSDWKQDWHVCHEHKLKWIGDYGIYTPQEYVLGELEGEAAVEQFHTKNLAILADCCEVEPFHWPPLPPTTGERLAATLRWFRARLADLLVRLGMLAHGGDPAGFLVTQLWKEQDRRRQSPHEAPY